MSIAAFANKEERAVDYYRPEIATTLKTVSVTASYNPEFIEAARKLGGVFDTGTWVFSRREEIAVRQATERCFGYDGLTEPGKVDVEIHFAVDVISDRHKAINILARPIARAYEDQPKPMIGYGTIINSGTIEVINAQAICRKDTNITLRDVPLNLVERQPESTQYTTTILQSDHIALELLFYEHDQHIARITEIKRIFDLSKTDMDEFFKTLETKNALL